MGGSRSTKRRKRKVLSEGEEMGQLLHWEKRQGRNWERREKQGMFVLHNSCKTYGAPRGPTHL